MKFSELLNDYTRTLNCTGKELSELSGISSSVISRYRSGEREPQSDSDTLAALVKALAANAADRQIEHLSEQNIMASFEKVLLSKSKDYEKFIHNFNTLYNLLNLNMKELSAFTNSKIKSPSIHFVVKHPRLVQVLQNFTIPVIE